MSPSKEHHDLVRIVFDLDPNEWHGSATERLWADDLGEGRYRLRNTPFYAFGVSFEDIVRIEERDGQLFYAGVIMHSGHSTYRIFLLKKHLNKELDKYWESLQLLGCSYEQGIVYAVDVPPNANIKTVQEILETGAAAGIWDYDEGHCAH